MAPTVKDVENATSTNTATLPSTQVAAPAAAAARPQPIPLEVPVSVNGARTMEGSDKREPFSESTKTVLVFANGAVIRLASSVAPGQLLFVTNDKTKKEVVCQVVKSKNYRTVTGYVELEFTESAPGFWGVRIPTEAAPASAQPKAPVAQRPVATPTAVSPTIGTPKVIAPAPPAPVAAHTTTPVAPPPPAKPIPAPPAAVLAVTPKPEPAKPPVQPVAPPAPVKAEALSAQLAVQLSVLVASEPVSTTPQSAVPQAAKPSAPQKSTDDSTEQLRQQTARLQEQLSSLLFREAAAEKSAAPPTPPPVLPVIAPTPVTLVASEMLRGADALQKAVAELESIAKPEAKPEAKVEAIKTSPIPAAVAEIKAPSVVSKTSAISLPVEEVKIPSWLAPLARDTESPKDSSSHSQSNPTATEDISSRVSSDEISSDISSDSSQKTQSVVFGGQLLGGAEANAAQPASSGSNKGLVFGLVAAAVLVAAGLGWYGMQPGNFLASKPPVSQAVQNNAAVFGDAAAKTGPVAAAPASSVNPTTPGPSSAANRSATTSPANLPPEENSRNANPVSSTDTTASATSAARNVPAVEAPKKPTLGDVRLATPNVNRSTDFTGNEAAPSIDGDGVATAADPLAELSVAHSKEPSAPLPIGGDVKPARLLKSTSPVYPPAARVQRIAGDVKLDALIDAAGNVSATKIISGPTLLHQAAIAAVKQWKYEPAQLNGGPTSMHLTVTVEFRLQ
jgi:TonB family protein